METDNAKRVFSMFYECDTNCIIIINDNKYRLGYSVFGICFTLSNASSPKAMRTIGANFLVNYQTRVKPVQSLPDCH